MQIINKYKNQDYSDMLETDFDATDAVASLEGMQAVALQLAAARLEARKHLPSGKHERAGITTNKGRGQSKARRKMAKASRRRHQG